MAYGDAPVAAESGVYPLENLSALQDLFEVVGFVTAAQKAGKTGLIVKKGKGGAGSFGLDDLLVYSNDPIPSSLLKLNPDNTNRAISMFSSILAYQGDSTTERLTDQQRVETVQKLLHQGLKRTEMRDELYMQLLKQTRGNIISESRFRAWELFHLVASTMPPGKDFVGLVSSYVNARAADQNELEHIHRVCTRTWHALKRTSRAGPRRLLPSAEEITATIKDTKLSTVVFFMDETFDNLDYDPTTTVQEATGAMAQKIKLENFQSFTLFECLRTMPNTKMAGPPEPVTDEYFVLHDNRYIADVVVDFRNKNEKAGKDASSKLVFRKRHYRRDEDDIDEQQFISLCYIQCQHDFTQGNYAVSKEVAAEMCALQMQAEHASTLMDDDEGIMLCVEKYVHKELLMTRPRDEWKVDVSSRYKALEQYSKDAARRKFLDKLHDLPYGHAVFFPVKKVVDPVGQLPPKTILGVNTRGVHFFRPSPKEYLHSVALKHIIQFGATGNDLYLKIRLAGVPHLFQFETKQGAEVCASLQTHINDVMTKKFIKAKAERGEGEDGANPVRKAINAKYEQHLHQLQRALEDAKNQVDQMQKANDELRYTKEKAVAEIADLNAILKVEEGARSSFENQVRTLEKTAEANKREIEMNKAKVSAAEAAAAAAGAELAAIDMERFAKVEQEVEQKGEEMAQLADALSEAEKKEIKLSKEKELVEAKVKRIEKAMEQENKELKERLAALSGGVKEQLVAKTARIQEMKEELTSVIKQRDEVREEIAQFRRDNNIMEMQEIRAMQEAVEAKARENGTILEEQAKYINELERKYKDEQVTRKRLFNALEDIKGKIRVYCRVRPLLKFELDKGEKFALLIPNDVTIGHMWKDEKKPREYTFDQIFPPGTPQDVVFEDTRHCVQSAVDGYNVCIFAYGQTGSGKTFTIYGNEKEPGLTPRGVRELFNILGRDKGKFAYKVQFYMLELYCDAVQDLLLPSGKRANPPKLEIKRDPKGMVTIVGSTIVDVRDYDHLMATIDYGQKARHVSATSMNKESSRSHLIMSILIEGTNLSTQSVVRGKLSFVDLAGSERIKKSNAAGEQLKEAQAINKSLSALGNVISALATENPHVPYRDHKLTMIMSDSLGGTAKTLMFVNCSPAEYNVDETQNSLNYALRVGKIKNLVKDSGKEDRETLKVKKRIEFWKGQAGMSESDRDKAWKQYEEPDNLKYLEEGYK